MRSLRIAAEWGFAKVTNLFAYLDLPRGLRIWLSPIGLYYRVAVLFTNAHSCNYSNQASEYFNCPAPTLNEYFP